MSATSVTTNKAISLLSQIDGRDKIYKTCQYGSRLVWWMLHTKGADPKLLGNFASLDSSFSEARRVFRLGGFIKVMKDLAREPLLKGNTDFLHSFKFLSVLSNLIGEYMDVIIYATKIKVMNVNKSQWEWWRNCMWMVTILYAFADQIASMRQTLVQRKHLLLQKKLIEYSDITQSTKYSEKFTISTTSLREKLQLNNDIAEVHNKITDIIYTCIRYCCDFGLCSAMLASKEHKGLFGLLGVLSGSLGLMQSWKKL